ncbi:hypothetical protein ASU31_00445 [Pedobacter ginsenosidimutans]|uniref:O-antigen ligase-related domain-containing protein n=1 Tax=Pedobacter ginsenosidimutans TaxID=687842 RepID=A0A0T5VVB8_9SPHI|nr:O-antigen ligase family protein [Pedobacter ginsenosidimutans]KRT17803.1 hypothetical protein ASU31_00445 [Pedobacter ginsenosidimutans]
MLSKIQNNTTRITIDVKMVWHYLRRNLSIICILLILTLSFGLSTFEASRVFRGYSISIAALFITIFSVVLVYSSRSRWYSVTYIDLLFALLVCINFAALSNIEGYSLIGFLLCLLDISLFIFLISCRHIAGASELRNLFVVVLFFLSVILAAFTLCIYHTESNVIIRSGGLLKNSGINGIAIGCFAIPMLTKLNYFFSKYNAVIKVLLISCLLLIFTAIAVTLSRTAIICIIITIAVIIYKNVNITVSLSKQITLFCSFSAVLLFIFLSYLFTTRLKQGSTNGRIFIWGLTTEIITDNLILGVGPGGFTSTYNSYQIKLFSKLDGTEKIYHSASVSHPYNEAMYQFVEKGFLGFLIWFALFLSICRELKRKDYSNYACYSMPLLAELTIPPVLAILLVLKIEITLTPIQI